MIITFCGHSQYLFNKKDTALLEKVLLQQITKNPACEFFLGGYGNFDELCLTTLLKLKQQYKNIKITFVTPYVDKNYSKLQFAKYYYDCIIFPPLEHIPRKFAIIKRNKWMVDNSDLVIAYVCCDLGGAFKTLLYAKRKNIPIINIYQEDN